MGKQLHENKSLFVIAGGFFVLVVIITLTSYSQSGTDVSDRELSTANYPQSGIDDANQELETPLLIAQAFARGEITNEQRLLYLAYALYEHESLPHRFVSYYGWFGEMAQYELEVLNDPAVFCSMSSYARSEFQRLLKIDTTCERSILFPVLAGVLAIITFVFHVRRQNLRNFLPD